jgi:RES domain-containing protein
VVPADDETLARIVRTLNIMRVSTLVFRAVPLKYATSVDSVEGARIYGGRYNPPAHLAASLCSLPEGFGYLYTATNPLTCLFECEHVLRGLGENEFQMVPVEPTLLVSFRADADNVLDLRDPVNQQRLGVEGEQLTSLDDRADLNEAGELTVLQRIGVAAYKSGRFSGVVVPSRFGDIAHGYCFNFLPREVKPKLRDHAGILRKINFLASP